MSADLGTGLYAWAKTVSALTAIIGAGDACQFYPVADVGGNAPPKVVYEEMKDAEAAMHDAPATAATTAVTFTCIATDRAGAVALADAIYDGLMKPRFRGLMGSVYVQAALYKKSSPSYQWEEYQYAVDAEYQFCYNL